MSLSSFQKNVQDDISGVFLGLGEFAGVHNVDGKEVMAIVDEDEFRQENTGMLQDAGLYQQRVVLYVKTEDVPVPARGNEMTVDGEYFYIEESSHQMGVYRITLAAVRQ